MNQYDAIVKYIPSKDSGDSQWISWYEMLKKGFGREKANKAFIVAYANLAGSAAKTNKLRDYGKTVGLDLDTNLIEDASRIVGNVKESIGGVFDSFGSIFKTSKTIVIVVILAILVPVFLALFNIAKNPNAVIGAASSGFAKSKGM
ncbi:MAG: hypothetical protein PHT07_15165 [Paludibacter sp.]|nr:hypothetical protein [Paludibacter sp.]